MLEPNISPLPRLSLSAYTETAEVTGLLNEVLGARAMRRVQGEVAYGGFVRAVEGLTDTASLPDVLIVEVAQGISPEALQADIERLASACDHPPELFVIGHTNDVALYRVVKDVGGADYLLMPTTANKVVARLARAFANHDAGTGSTVAVLGARGGCGASTIAAGLAWTIAGQAKERTALVDLALPFGGLATALDVKVDLDNLLPIYRAGSSDAELLSRMVTAYGGNLWLLPCPNDLTQQFASDGSARGALMALLRAEFRFSILDLAHEWSASAQHTLEHAEDVVLVVTPDHAGVKNAQAILRYLQRERGGDGMRPVRVVLNMTGLPAEWAEKDVVEALATKPAASIRYDAKAFNTAIAHGRLLREGAMQHLFTRSLGRLAADLLGPSTEPMTRRKAGGPGLLGRLLPRLARA